MDAGTKGWARNNAPLSEAMYAHKYLGGNECGRCGGSVYSAEELLGAGLVCVHLSLFVYYQVTFYHFLKLCFLYYLLEFSVCI